MVCDGVYGENQRDIVIESLLSAKSSVMIAVAWINFKEYRDTLLSILNKGIEIRVVVNNDVKNSRYKDIIESLCQKGMQFKMLRPQKTSQYMHHKFCVIDCSMILTGSFNWTKNANDNNFEDLTVSHQEAIVMGYCNIFESLWQLTSKDFAMLRNPNICNCCREPIANLCVFSQEGYNETRAEIFQVCGCGELRFINNEFFTIHVYQNLIGIFDKFSDEREYCEMNGCPMDEEKENTKFDYAINNYLSELRRQRMGMPIIHAVGLYGQRLYHRNIEERFIQVLWKERYTSRFVLDEYPLE